MPQVINMNIASLNAQRNLNQSQSALQTSLQRLSSGLRINSAKDDAAGLAISERFTSQIRGLNQAARNANDAISLSQTAEGALGEISNNVQRIRELAVQAANATNSASDRTALQNEVSQLVSEIDRVAQQTAFNGVTLLDGTFTSQAFQVGANAGQTISISSISSARTSDLGTSFNAAATGGAVTGVALVAGDLTVNGVDVGVVAGDAKAIAAKINATGTGVTATANSFTVAGGTTSVTATSAGTITINGYTTQAITATGTAATDRATITSAINAMSAATGVSAVDDGTGIDLVSSDGRNITHSVTQTAATWTAGVLGLAAATTSYGTVSLQSSRTITLGGNTETKAGFTDGQVITATAGGTALSGIDVSTVAGATSAITSADAALATVSSARATLGAYQNRFTSTIANLQTAAENLSASRSRIQAGERPSSMLTGAASNLRTIAVSPRAR
jgi:flagellin